MSRSRLIPAFNYFRAPGNIFRKLPLHPDNYKNARSHCLLTNWILCDSMCNLTCPLSPWETITWFTTSTLVNFAVTIIADFWKCQTNPLNHIHIQQVVNLKDLAKQQNIPNYLQQLSRSVYSRQVSVIRLKIIDCQRVSFGKIHWTVSSLSFLVLGPSYCGITRPLSWRLMPSLLLWVCKINGCLSWVSMGINWCMF